MLTRQASQQRGRPRFHQRGLSIVEMMIGVAVGLFVVAVATVTVATQLGENRRLLIDTQLQQDLRATADIVTRELRRAGAWVDAQSAVASVASPIAVANPYSAITTPASAVTYRYQQPSSDSYGFQLSGHVIQAQLSSTTGYQNLTDESTMAVDSFDITETNGSELQIPCPHMCPDGTTNCWPTAVVRYLTVAITAHAVTDAAVTRSINSTVRVRNDLLRFNGPQYCPT